MKHIKLFENFKKSDLEDDGISLCQEVQDLFGIECKYIVFDDLIMVKSIDNIYIALQPFGMYGKTETLRILRCT